VSVMRKYQTTLALNYNTQLKAEKALSEIYGFESVFDYLLDLQDIRREVYEDHIDTLKRELPKHMRKYAKLVKEKYGLDKMTYADLKAPLMPEFEKEISIEDSKDYLRKGLAIFGEDYVNETLKHIDNKWIDFAQNEGKSTGAFCDPYYQLHSYVLISWMGKMEDVFVLAHELGHAGHGRYSSMDNSIINTESSMYISEMPSTCNEMLLANYLINSTDDEDFKKWVRVQMIERTYYHNFVTHGIEAIYQREVYRRIDKGENINADKLNEIFRNTLEEFWGDDVEILPGSELTWMRQPHYFMGLYPFTYQAGLSIGTGLFRKLQTSTDSEKKEIIENYKETMKTGGKLSPEDWAKKLGVQIEGGKALKDTIQYIGEIIDEISK
ncbi:MAG: M3 family metallopeptidase, partial [Ezakiella sp.]